MKYIVLLRGVNVSGNRKISMKELKLELENTYKNVLTYLNSGNIILESDIDSKVIIKENIYNIIKNKFNLEIPIFIMTVFELNDLLNNCPDWWGGNREMYYNLIFIIPPTKYEEIYNTIGSPIEDIEKIKEYNNCIFWSFNLKKYRKSKWWVKTLDTNIKDKITIRNSNTVKKLLEICNK